MNTASLIALSLILSAGVAGCGSGAEAPGQPGVESDTVAAQGAEAVVDAGATAFDPFGGIDRDAIVAASIDANGETRTFSTTQADPDKAYQFGSISKYVCTLAVMDMVEAGELSLDDTLSSLLPDYAGGGGNSVTLRHLLQNRSGIEDGISKAFQSDPDFLTTPRATLEATNLYAASNPTFEPGGQFDYALANWVAVQAVLEATDGRPIGDILEARVFQPAGMTSARLVVGPFDGPEDAVASSPFPPLPAFIGCAGGVAANVADLAQLVRFPYVEGGFETAIIEALTEISTEEEIYALGGRVLERTVDGTLHRISWQDGSNGPYKARAAFDPVDGSGLAVMTATGDGDALEAALDSWLDGTLP